MPYAVEIHLPDRSLVDSMTSMRVWLDKQRFEPDTFRYVTFGLNIRLRVEFKVQREAKAFAHAFDGRLLAARKERTARSGSLGGAWRIDSHAG